MCGGGNAAVNVQLTNSTKRGSDIIYPSKSKRDIISLKRSVLGFNWRGSNHILSAEITVFNIVLK